MKFQNTLIERLAGYAAVVAIVVAFSFYLFATTATKAHANPSYFDRSAGTFSSPTTGLNFMTPGLATTTETFDTAHGRTGSLAMDSAVLQLAIKSSTTVTTQFGTTTLSLRIEQSDNCTDWSLATSSTLQTTQTEQVGTLAVASTTYTMRTITVATPLRCVRALVGVQPGSSNNAGVWAQFVGKRENN